MDQLHHMELNLPPDIWRPLAQQRWAIRCPAGYLIYLQNTAATCFYYLKSGQVKSFIQSPDGGERVLNLYQEGSLFGEASFFDELPRVSCPQEEIAATISVSRVTVSRILNQLSREGLIALSYRSVQILDRPGLEELCQ